MIVCFAPTVFIRSVKSPVWAITRGREKNNLHVIVPKKSAHLSYCNKPESIPTAAMNIATASFEKSMTSLR